MSQKLSNIQEQQQVQQQVQQQRLNAQQVLVVHMLEMPLTQLEQQIQAEMDENPALEGDQPDETEGVLADGEASASSLDDVDGGTDGDDYESQREAEEKMAPTACFTYGVTRMSSKQALPVACGVQYATMPQRTDSFLIAGFVISSTSVQSFVPTTQGE